MRPTPTGEHVIVETAAGAVRGAWREGSAAFLGIPFAEPPGRRAALPAPGAARAVGGRPRRPRVRADAAAQALCEITTIPEPCIPGERP